MRIRRILVVCLALVIVLGLGSLVDWSTFNKTVELSSIEDVSLVSRRVHPLSRFFGSGTSSRSTIDGEGRGFIERTGASFESLVGDAYLIPRGGFEVQFDAPDTVFDLRLGSPSVLVPDYQQTMRSVLEEAFGFRSRIETRTQECRILGCPSRSTGLRPTTARNASTRTVGRPSGFDIEGGTMETVASAVGTALGERVLDETDIEGQFDVSLTWTSKADLERKLAAFGLTLEVDQREFEVLVLEEVSAGSSLPATDQE